MVYDEEDGVMIELSALVASAGGSGRRPSPELPAMPEPHAQLPEEVIHASEGPPRTHAHNMHCTPMWTI